MGYDRKLEQSGTKYVLTEILNNGIQPKGHCQKNGGRKKDEESHKQRYEKLKNQFTSLWGERNELKHTGYLNQLDLYKLPLRQLIEQMRPLKLKIEENRQINGNRRKKKIINKIDANPDCNRFLTLTFSEDIRDVQEANKYFKKFKDRLRHYVGKKKSVINPETGKPYLDNKGNIKKYQLQEGLKMVGVIEFQDETRQGVVHYHLLVNQFIPQRILKDCWDFGFSKIEQIDNKNNVGFYMVKGYMDKGLYDPRLDGEKLPLKMGKLNETKTIDNEPIIYKDEEGNYISHNPYDEFLSQNPNILTEENKVSSSTYVNKHNGNEIRITTFDISQQSHEYKNKVKKLLSQHGEQKTKEILKKEQQERIKKRKERKIKYRNKVNEEKENHLSDLLNED